MSLVVEREFHLASLGGPRGGCRRTIRLGAEPTPVAAPTTQGRIPRVAKLMALAIRCDQLIRSGAVPDATALASLAHVSQPRMTQILNLTLLAPDIQEALLCLPPVAPGADTIHEKSLRAVCGMAGWNQQRRAMDPFFPATSIRQGKPTRQEKPA